MKMRNSKLLSTFILLTMQLSTLSALASGDKPSGTTSIETTSVAIGIGFDWGEDV
jgi:hypothetical protein